MGLSRRAILASTLAFGGSAAMAQQSSGAGMVMDTVKSIYDEPLEVTGADGRTFNVASLKGAPVLATMFFATCPDVCPIMTDRLMRVYSELPKAQRSRLRVFLVSFDPEDDGPAVLRAYAKSHEITDSHWKLAVADLAVSQRLADLLDIQFRRLDRASFSHIPMVNLIAPDGVVMARLPSVSLDTPLFSAAVKGLLAT